MKTLLVLSLFFALAVTFSTALAEEARLRLGGFVDAQVGWSDRSSPGFSIADGGLYLRHEVESHSLRIDLPFSWGGGATNALQFGASPKAQAFISRA